MPNRLTVANDDDADDDGPDCCHHGISFADDCEACRDEDEWNDGWESGDGV